MEERKKKGSSSSSSSSLTSQLFGSRDNPSSSSTFGSIFAPPSKVLGRESIRQETLTTGWNDKTSKTENHGSIYQDQKIQPCHLSSSIYYGGPDVYFQSQNSTINSKVNLMSEFSNDLEKARNFVSDLQNGKDGGEDDSGSASRGNWWQGSLYY